MTTIDGSRAHRRNVGSRKKCCRTPGGFQTRLALGSSRRRGARRRQAMLDGFAPTYTPTRTSRRTARIVARDRARIACVGAVNRGAAVKTRLGGEHLHDTRARGEPRAVRPRRTSDGARTGDPHARLLDPDGTRAHAGKQRKAVAADLQLVYRASTVEDAGQRLEEFAVKWDGAYPTISQMWRRNWEHLTPFFAYPADIRRVIYTTNAVESLNMSLRKIIKTRGSFPNQEAAMKLLYLALEHSAELTPRTFRKRCHLRLSSGRSSRNRRTVSGSEGRQVASTSYCIQPCSTVAPWAIFLGSFCRLYNYARHIVAEMSIAIGVEQPQPDSFGFSTTSLDSSPDLIVSRAETRHGSSPCGIVHRQEEL